MYVPIISKMSDKREKGVAQLARKKKNLKLLFIQRSRV